MANMKLAVTRRIKWRKFTFISLLGFACTLAALMAMTFSFAIFFSIVAPLILFLFFHVLHLRHKHEEYAQAHIDFIRKRIEAKNMMKKLHKKNGIEGSHNVPVEELRDVFMSVGNCTWNRILKGLKMKGEER